MNGRISTIEVVTRAERRRFDSEEKLAIVRETLVPGASVGEVARRHGLSAGLVYRRDQMLQNLLAEFFNRICQERTSCLAKCEPGLDARHA